MKDNQPIPLQDASKSLKLTTNHPPTKIKEEVLLGWKNQDLIQYYLYTQQANIYCVSWTKKMEFVRDLDPRLLWLDGALLRRVGGTEIEVLAVPTPRVQEYWAAGHTREDLQILAAQEIVVGDEIYVRKVGSNWLYWRPPGFSGESLQHARQVIREASLNPDFTHKFVVTNYLHQPQYHATKSMVCHVGSLNPAGRYHPPVGQAMAHQSHYFRTIPIYLRANSELLLKERPRCAGFMGWAGQRPVKIWQNWYLDYLKEKHHWDARMVELADAEAHPWDLVDDWPEALVLRAQAEKRFAPQGAK